MIVLRLENVLLMKSPNTDRLRGVLIYITHTTPKWTLQAAIVPFDTLIMDFFSCLILFKTMDLVDIFSKIL